MSAWSLTAKYIQLAGFVILLYDHSVLLLPFSICSWTFSASYNLPGRGTSLDHYIYMILPFEDQVERIWKQKISGASVLFLIIRYVTPLQLFLTIDGVLGAKAWSNWSAEVSIQPSMTPDGHPP